MVDDWKQANPGYKEGGFINKKARKSRRKSRNKKIEIEELNPSLETRIKKNKKIIK